MRSRRLKHGTHVDSGQMYIYRNQAAAAYLSLYFFTFLSLQFSTLKFFITFFSGTARPRRLNLGTQMDWAAVSCIPESGCCSLFVPLFLHFSFSPIFNIEIFCHTSLELWGLDLKISTRGHWADVSCILESGCCCLFIPLFIFLSFQF